MKRFVPLWSLIALIAGCGLRTQMDGCSEGSAGCPCLAGACDPGLVCESYLCVEPLVGSGGRPATGGTPASGGDAGRGGNGRGGASGGVVGSGGRTGSGGMVGYGGAPAGGAGTRSSGGRLGSGGTAGVSSVGGRSGSGGAAGTTSVGGRFGRGGAAGYTGVLGGTGGAASSGGSFGSGGTLDVTFSNGRANGAMDGWGWPALGSKASLTSPTCGGQPLTSATAAQCSSFEWSSTSSLCMTGTVPSSSGADYSENWGVMIGARSTSSSGGGLGNSYSAITLELSGSPSSGLRAVVHRKGDSDGTSYCTYITPGTAVSFTSFNTACWDGSGKTLTMADVPSLDWVAVMVPAVSSTVKVSNLCLNRIRFAW